MFITLRQILNRPRDCGVLPTNNLGLWTFYGIFKGSVPVVLLVNSNTPANVTSVVDTAFINASVPHP